jgi:RsiW-degrading membrane proteinase PrsW (M82 family)
MNLAATPPPFRGPSLTDIIMTGSPYSQYSLCLTLAVLIFAIAIIRNGWGMGYRLSLIPASLMPLLIGFGAAGYNLMRELNFIPYDTGFSHFISRPGECFVILVLCLYQTVLLLAVTAFAFLNLKNGQPAALIATRPEP